MVELCTEMDWKEVYMVSRSAYARAQIKIEDRDGLLNKHKCGIQSQDMRQNFERTSFSELLEQSGITGPFDKIFEFSMYNGFHNYAVQL